MANLASAVWMGCQRVALIFSVVLAIALFYAPVSLAEEFHIDLEQHCREQFGSGVAYDIDYNDGGALCSDPTGNEQHKIDVGEVCFAAHQSERYIRAGSDVTCLTKGSWSGTPIIYLPEACQSLLIDTVSFSQTSDGVITCKSVFAETGEVFTADIYVDYVGACERGYLEGDFYYCGSWSFNGVGTSYVVPADAPPPTRIRRDIPALDPKDIIDAGGSGDLMDSAVTLSHILECGNGYPEAVMLSAADYPKAARNPKGLGGWGWLYMGFDLPCPGLTGGHDD